MDNPALREAVEAYPNILFVCAVGNSRRDFDAQPSYPAGYQLPNVISVASTNNDGGFSYYSNYGTQTVDIAARGRDVLSTLPENQTGLLSGTSMSAGFVSGAAGVLAARMSAAEWASGVDSGTSTSSASLMTMDQEIVSKNTASQDTVTQNITTGIAAQLKNELLGSADSLSNLNGFVREDKKLNLTNALSSRIGAYLSLQPVDDFNSGGYAPASGENNQLFSTDASSKVIKVATGNVSLVLKQDGTVWVWGYNGYYQCANEDFSNLGAKLTQVQGLPSIIDIAVGGYHCLALDSDGYVWAWGTNSYGYLGNGTCDNDSHTIPAKVIGLDNVTAISAGTDNSLALKSNGTVWAWGYNGYGQLGDGSEEDRPAPVQVEGLGYVTAISSGEAHNLALTSDSTVWGWGYGYWGQIGDGNWYCDYTYPTRAYGLSGIKAISACGNGSLALKSDGTVWAWGTNYDEAGLELGDDQPLSTPGKVIGLSGVIAISSGNQYAFAIKSLLAQWINVTLKTLNLRYKNPCSVVFWDY